jgi:uncharacterized protein YneF (UPF0154 family)
MTTILMLTIIIVTFLAGVLSGYFFNRYQTEQARKAESERAENILQAAQTQARLIESKAREDAVKIVQAAEQELKERRVELNREAERSGTAAKRAGGACRTPGTAGTKPEQAPERLG